MSNEENADLVLALQSPWKENKNSLWLASTLTLLRNIEKFNFPAKLPPEKRKQIVSLITKELQNNQRMKNSTLVKGEEATPLEKEFLYEHFLAGNNLIQAHAGEGFVLDSTGTVFCAINLEDHIHLQLIDCEGNLENAWNDLERLETELGTKLSYSFSSRFGFLTADPANCGTGLIVSAYLQLPALIHTGGMQEFLAKNQNDAIYITGLQGTLDEFTGDLVIVRNNYTIGLSEEDIISSLNAFVTRLLVHEKGIRADLRQAERSDIKDKVSRAFGAIMNSYLIESIEALNEISLLKLGLDLGWLTGTSVKELNSLFFNCRRAHLLSHFKDEISHEELPHTRAEYIHKFLKKAELHI